MGDISHKLLILERYRFYAKIVLLLILILGSLDPLVEIGFYYISIFIDSVITENGNTIVVETDPYHYLYLGSLFSVIISLLLELKGIDSKESRVFDWFSSIFATILLVKFITIIIDHRDTYSIDYNPPFFLLLIIIILNLVRYVIEVIYHIKYLNSK